MGIQLPGSQSAKAEIPIEGILKLAFKKLEISVAETPDNPVTGAPASTAYTLLFRSITIGLLGIKFPPVQIDLYIFGNPSDDKSAVGWYACYSGKDKQKEISAARN